MNGHHSESGRINVGWARSNQSSSMVCEDTQVGEFVDTLVGLAVDGLGRMFRSDRQIFAHTLQRSKDGEAELLGDSVRYSAIALLGIGKLDQDAQREILDGETAAAFCGRLIDGIDSVEDLGDVALITWAAAELAHPQLDRVLARLQTLDGGRMCETAPAAWVVSALTAASRHVEAEDAARAAVGRLMGAARDTGVFSHHTGASAGSAIRRHVACFADQVYPIQALACYSASLGDGVGLAIAGKTAERICEVMGDSGQWWWHYDTRTGKVVEGYPVYSVHQDSMAPMALLDLADAGGSLHTEAIRAGLGWLKYSPEIDGSLVDIPSGIIWRKVGRRDPKKFVRATRAIATRVRPGSPPGLVNTVFPAGTVDWESRPYHLGWILYSWVRSEA